MNVPGKILNKIRRLIPLKLSKTSLEFACLLAGCPAHLPKPLSLVAVV